MVIPYVIMCIGYEGGIGMAKMGRPKTDDPTCHVVTVKFKESEYQLMLEYTKNHNISISQLIKMGVAMQMHQSQK